MKQVPADDTEWSARREARLALALWFSWPGGLEMHELLQPRADALSGVCASAERIADAQFGTGLRIWEAANWLTRVWIEVCVLPDESWQPSYFEKPRAHIFNGSKLVLPLIYDLGDVADKTDDQLVGMLLEAAPRLIDQAARSRRWGAVPWNGIEPEGGIQTSREPMTATQRARALRHLWSTLEAVGADPERPALDTIEAVGDELHRRGKVVCREFHTGMHLALYELDREGLFLQPVRDRGEDPAAPTTPLSDDTFLYARAAVVLSGKPTFDSVLADNHAFAAEPRDMDAEDLLGLPETVMEALGEELQPPPGLPSYETGSNVAHWTSRS